jgi:ParB-like chromosome segregation protein Spo0J
MRITRLLPVANIIVKDKLPMNRSVFDLARYINTQGPVKPIKVQKIWATSCPLNPMCKAFEHGGHYEYRLQDGRHRLAAYKLLGLKMIEVTYGEVGTTPGNPGGVSEAQQVA